MSDLLDDLVDVLVLVEAVAAAVDVVEEPAGWYRLD